MYRLIEVTDSSSRKQFHRVPLILYRHDPCFVAPPEAMVEGIFTPATNPFFAHGVATRWVLVQDDGKLVGRVAAFINYQKANNFNVPTGGMGFFECIPDQQAANLLFGACRQWLEQRGMQAMDGPINFGENDNFWGLLVEGFMPQSFGMNYNPPYYKELFDNYGFTLYFEQVTNHLDRRKPFPERFWKIADWVRQKPEYQFRHFKWEQSGKFIADFIEVYNDAWQYHENFTPMDAEAVQRQIGQMKGVLVPEFIWFAYHQDEPIAFEVMIPDLNQMLKFFHGKINLWGKLRILLHGRKKVFTRARITIMGVKPKYQKSGVESAMFWHMDKVMERYPQYTEIELSWVGDFNPKMRMLHESVGASFAKRHYTLRKYFTEGVEHARSSIIPADTRNKSIAGG